MTPSRAPFIDRRQAVCCCSWIDQMDSMISQTVRDQAVNPHLIVRQAVLYLLVYPFGAMIRGQFGEIEHLH